MSAPKFSELDIQTAIEDLAHIKDPQLREGLLNLVRLGLITDSGRRRDGHIVWAAATIVERH